MTEMQTAATYPAAVVFDNDGVLVDSEPFVNRVLAVALAEAGLDMSPHEVESQFLGGTLATVRRWAKAERSIVLPPDFESRYNHQLMARLDGELHAVRGVRPVLEELVNAGTEIGVASNSERPWVLRALAVSGLDDLIPPDVIVTINDVESGKPAPDVYLAAAARVGQPAGSCVAVDDSRPGIEAARRARMRTVGFAERTSRSALQAADATVASMDTLLSALQGVVR
jgi:HAD superfamily hydrolase (TIGR01509 family)